MGSSTQGRGWPQREIWMFPLPYWEGAQSKMGSHPEKREGLILSS